MDKKIVIAVHDGTFHADDVFAVATLLILLESKPVEVRVVRSRDEEIIRDADFVVDVGAIHDDEKERYDHHQPGGAGERENGVKYASFGLVWKKYGEVISGSRDIASHVDSILVQPIDYGDNQGLPLTEIAPGVYPYTIDRMISSFGSVYSEPERDVDEQFFRLVAIARDILNREIVHGKAVVEAAPQAEEAYKKAEDKRIIILDSKFPWYASISKYSEPLFVVFPDSKDGRWGVSAVKKGLHDFSNRKDFPISWAGKRDGDLVEISGVEDAVFCHNRLFFAVAKSREGAIELAFKALE